MKESIKVAVYFLKKTWLIFLVAAIIVIAGLTSIEIYREEVLNIDPDVEFKTSGYQRSLR